MGVKGSTTKAQRRQRDAAVNRVADGLAALEKLGVYLQYNEPDGKLGPDFARPMDDVRRAVRDMRAASVRDDIEGLR